MTLKQLAWPVLALIAFAFGCQSNPPVQGEATPEQLRAAARYGVTASEQAAVVLHKGGVLDTDDFLAGVAAIHAARAALSAVSLSGFDVEDAAKAIAVAKAAWLLAQAGYQVANAAAITPEQASAWEAEGIAYDAEFDAYVEALK